LSHDPPRRRGRNGDKALAVGGKKEGKKKKSFRKKTGPQYDPNRKK